MELFNYENNTGFTTFGIRAVDPRPRNDGFDIDEDRRLLLREFLEKMIGAIDRCTARMNRIFEDMKANCVDDDAKMPSIGESPEEEKWEPEPELASILEPPLEIYIVNYVASTADEEEIEQYSNAQNMFPKNKLEHIQEKKQQIFPQEFASYGPTKPMAFQSEEIPTDEQFALSWSVEGIDLRNTGGKFKSYNGGMEGEQPLSDGCFNREVNCEFEQYRADEIKSFMLFDPGIKSEGNMGGSAGKTEGVIADVRKIKAMRSNVLLIHSVLRNADFTTRQFRKDGRAISETD